jgi:hypothetical protein
MKRSKPAVVLSGGIPGFAVPWARWSGNAARSFACSGASGSWKREVLGRASAWMTTRAIYDALEGRHRIHGYSTLKMTLSLMVRLDVLEARHNKPYGYRLKP